MNSFRILFVICVLFAGLSLSTVAFAAPISTEPSQHALAVSSPEPSKTPKPTKTPDANDDANTRIAEGIAKYFDVPVTEVIALHNEGMGWGGIVKAYALADATGMTVDEILGKREEKGWGAIVKSISSGKWKTNLGQIMRNDNANKNGDEAPGNSGDHRNDDKDKDKGKPDDQGKPDNPGKPDGKGKPDDKGKNK